MRRFLVFALLAVACVDKAPPAPAVDPALVAENLLTEPPANLQHPVGAVFDGKVTYLGNDVQVTHLAPGDKVVITHYWQINQAVGKNWKIFSHLVGDQGDFANVDLTDMRKGHTSDHWQPGQVIRDPQTFILRKDWRSPKATLVVGIYKKGGHKVTDRMHVTAGQAKDEAITVATFDIDVSKAAPLPGNVVIKKANGPINVDGKADEIAWKDALSTAAFQTAEGGPEPQHPTAGKLTWDDKNLYVFVSADDDDVASDYGKDDDTIWKQDVIEVFIDADGNGHGYVELQTSPKNVHFDAWFPTVRPQSDVAWSSKMVTAVNVRGTVNNHNDTDEGWDAELAIPFEAVKGGDPAMAVHVPPQPGDVWRLNVLRADYGKDGKPAAAAWNRIRYSDWHSLDRMLTVTFADGAGNTAPPSTPEAPTTPTAPATAPATGVMVLSPDAAVATQPTGNTRIQPKATPQAPPASGASGQK